MVVGVSKANLSLISANIGCVHSKTRRQIPMSVFLRVFHTAYVYVFQYNTVLVQFEQGYLRTQLELLKSCGTDCNQEQLQK
jgi:hypothetical protein